MIVNTVSLNIYVCRKVVQYSLLHAVHSHPLGKQAAGWQLMNNHDGLLPTGVSTPPAEQYIRENSSCLNSFWPKNSTNVLWYCVLSSQRCKKCKLAKRAHIMLELGTYNIQWTNFQNVMPRCYTKAPTVQDTFWPIQVCTLGCISLFPPGEQCHTIITFEFHAYMCTCTSSCAFTLASQHKSGLTTFKWP